MAAHFRIMAVLAHPDDESLGLGGALAKYAHDDVETFLVTATRGERGRFFGPHRERPSDEEVGRVREAELRAAAEVLGVKEVHLLDYLDRDLDAADPPGVIGSIAACIRRICPHVVITFGPDGAYGHPDHIAISQFTTAAIVAAADSMYVVPRSLDPPHRVSKLYFMALPPAAWEAYQSAFKRLVTTVDGVEREVTPWPEWAITTRIDTAEHWPTVWRAIQCHETQMSIYQSLADLTEEDHRALWGSQPLYRVFSLVNGGREREADVLEGLPYR